jgi:putative heme-binding domain-containing protein
LSEVKPATFTFLLARLDREQSVADRGLAADVLARAKLTGEQLIALAGAFKTISPTDADRLLEAFVQSTSEDVGLALLTALKASPVRSSLRAEMIRPRLEKYGPGIKREAESLYALLNADAAKQKAKLDELLASFKGGDIRRGQAVFNSTKAACASCHAIGYLGGNIGPDLTHIGSIRNERDLLESIVFPSASFVRSYEPVQITTKKGKVHNGLVRRETPDEVVLATSATEEVRIARQDIDEVQPGKVSIMPAGLDQQLTPQELADLVTFLKACK